MSMQSYPSESHPIRLTAAIIVREAVELLPRTLESVAGVADEVVVVDTGSCDGTAELAEQRGARVVYHAWGDDFAAARNAALTAARGEWVLWLDAGEALDAEAAIGLRTFLAARPAAEAAYLLLVEVPPIDAAGHAEQAARLRLHPHIACLRFEGRVRESLQPALREAGIEIAPSPWRILRTARDQDSAVKRAKALRDLRIANAELAEAGQRPRLLLALGEAFAALDDHRRAAEFFRQATRLARRGSTEMLEGYYGLLTTYDHRPEARQEQLGVCLEALEAFPLDAQLLCAMAGYLQAEGRPDMAARSYQAAVEHGQIDLETWHLRDLAEVTTVCWSLTLQLLGNEGEARRVLEEGLARQAASARIGRALLELHVKAGRDEEALAQFARLTSRETGHEALKSAIRGACLAARQNWIAATAYLQTAYTAGCRDPICLRALAITLLTNGQRDAAEQILREWRTRDESSAEPRAFLEALAKQAGSSSSQSGPAIPAAHWGGVDVNSRANSP